jgi:hypothetical protein
MSNTTNNTQSNKGNDPSVPATAISSTSEESAKSKQGRRKNQHSLQKIPRRAKDLTPFQRQEKPTSVLQLRTDLELAEHNCARQRASQNYHDYNAIATLLRQIKDTIPETEEFLQSTHSQKLEFLMDNIYNNLNKNSNQKQAVLGLPFIRQELTKIHQAMPQESESRQAQPLQEIVAQAVQEAQKDCNAHAIVEVLQPQLQSEKLTDAQGKALARIIADTLQSANAVYAGRNRQKLNLGLQKSLINKVETWIKNGKLTPELNVTETRTASRGTPLSMSPIYTNGLPTSKEKQHLPHNGVKNPKFDPRESRPTRTEYGQAAGIVPMGNSRGK